MTRADQQTYFIAQMISDMNKAGFISGVYVEHACERDHLCFIIFSLDPRDRDRPYLPVRMSWDDVRQEFKRLGLYDPA